MKGDDNIDQTSYQSAIDHATVPKEFLERVYANTESNKIILRYYNRLYKEEQTESLLHRAEKVRDCNDLILIDRYEISKIRDYKKTNLCNDRFCANCKKVKQAARMTKYVPVLEKHKDYLFHMTLTQPNCTGEELKRTIKKMAIAFRRLIAYLRGDINIRIKGVDFTEWGYKGAIRSLEVTYKNDSYHPHYHVALALDCDIGEKTKKNTYSKSYKSDQLKLFSDKEVLIQKIWYLLMNDQIVTIKSIDALNEGYSCVIDRFKESDYAELFKYATKVTAEDHKILTYEHFKTLYHAMHSVKQIQGYGVFYRVKDEVTEDMIAEVESMYNALIEYLQSIESPIQEISLLKELLEDFQYKLISRKRIFRYLVDVMASE